MAEENNNGGGLANSEFTPSQDFLDSFKNTVIEGDDNNGGAGAPPPPVKTAEDLAAEKAAADAAANGGAGGTTPSAEEKKKAEDEAARLEAEKVAKMSPEEKTAYDKEKSGAGAPPPVVKSFDEEFAERFGGKKPDEVKAAIETPAEAVFANEQIKFFNELAKQGVKIDADYVYQITRDYESMTDPVDILAEKIRQDNPKWTDEMVEYEIRQKYKMDEWAAEGEEPTPIEKVMALRQLLEADEARDSMIEKRNSLTFIKTEDPKAKEQAAKDRLTAQTRFETTIDNEIVPKVPSLQTKFTDEKGTEHTIEFQVDDSARGKVVQLMKAMGSDINAYWPQFSGKDGKFDHVKFYEMQLKAQNYEKAVKSSYERGLALGEERVAKDIRNTDFGQNGKGAGAGGAVKTFGEAAAESLAKNF